MGCRSRRCIAFRTVLGEWGWLRCFVPSFDPFGLLMCDQASVAIEPPAFGTTQGLHCPFESGGRVWLCRSGRKYFCRGDLVRLFALLNGAPPFGAHTPTYLGKKVMGQAVYLSLPCRSGRKSVVGCFSWPLSASWALRNGNRTRLTQGL